MKKSGWCRFAHSDPAGESTALSTLSTKPPRPIATTKRSRLTQNATNTATHSFRGSILICQAWPTKPTAPAASIADETGAENASPIGGHHRPKNLERCQGADRDQQQLPAPSGHDAFGFRPGRFRGCFASQASTTSRSTWEGPTSTLRGGAGRRARTPRTVQGVVSKRSRRTAGTG